MFPVNSVAEKDTVNSTKQLSNISFFKFKIAACEFANHRVYNLYLNTTITERQYNFILSTICPEGTLDTSFVH